MYRLIISVLYHTIYCNISINNLKKYVDNRTDIVVHRSKECKEPLTYPFFQNPKTFNTKRATSSILTTHLSNINYALKKKNYSHVLFMSENSLLCKKNIERHVFLHGTSGISTSGVQHEGTFFKMEDFKNYYNFLLKKHNLIFTYNENIIAEEVYLLEWLNYSNLLSNTVPIIERLSGFRHGTVQGLGYTERKACVKPAVNIYGVKWIRHSVQCMEKVFFSNSFSPTTINRNELNKLVQKCSKPQPK